MPDDPPNVNATSTSSDVRFSMRGLLAVMLAVAIGSTILGPYFRSIPPEARGEATLLWGSSVVVALAQIVRIGRKRFRLEQLAGPRLVALPRSERFFRMSLGPFSPWAIVFGGLLLVVFGLFYLAIRGWDSRPGRSASSDLYDMIFPALICGTLVARGIVIIWWQRAVQLRENGVLYGTNYLPWDLVTGRRNGNYGWVVEGVNELHQDVQLRFDVPVEQRSLAEQVFAAKLPSRTRTSPAASEAAAAPVPLPAVTISGQQKVSLRGALMLILMYVSVILLVALQPFGEPPIQFFVGIGVGMFAMSLPALAYWRTVTDAGPLLVRLSERFNLPLAFLSVAGMFAMYFLAQSVAYWSLLLAGIFGVGCGIAVSLAFSQLIQSQVDLCENGVVFVGRRFVVWPRVQLEKWNRTDGRLVFCHLWRKIAAVVPLDQRDLVESLLKEKLAGQVES